MRGTINYAEFIHMLGQLYSAILTGLTRRNYRIRLHVTNYQLNASHFPVATERLRIFGTISYEGDSLSARWNRKERYHHFKHVWNEVTPMVSQVIG